eukprot:9140-Heterococcus_DN1.PRE.1
MAQYTSMQHNKCRNVRSCADLSDIDSIDLYTGNSAHSRTSYTNTSSKDDITTACTMCAFVAAAAAAAAAGLGQATALAMSGQSEPLAVLFRKATRNVHSVSDHLINSKLALALLDRQGVTYGRALALFQPVYATLRTLHQKHAEHALLKRLPLRTSDV